MGEHWLQRVKAHADKAGKKTVLKEQVVLNSVCGVGGSSNSVRTKVACQLYLAYAQLKHCMA
eukprot:12902250-Prorocentrum_lima.AAC.1